MNWANLLWRVIYLNAYYYISNKKELVEWIFVFSAPHRLNVITFINEAFIYLHCLVIINCFESDFFFFYV